jgi:hypothetical protein
MDLQQGQKMDALRDTYQTMAEKGKGYRNKTPFIGVPYNVGSTSHHSTKKTVIEKQQYSFGCPRIFLRFSFTSAIDQVSYAYVDWAMFTAKTFHRTTFEGYISSTEWETGPRTRPTGNINPFVPCDHFIPSRFLLAYETTLDIAFIALDPERVGETIIDDGMITDLGDNILTYLDGHPDEDDGEERTQTLPSNLLKFLTTDF